MDRDRIVGASKEIAGKVEGAAGELAGSSKTEASGRAREAGEAAVNYAKDAVEKGGDTLQSGTKAVAGTVRDNPLGSMLIAGGIGFALAIMMTRPARRVPPRWRYYS